MEKKKKVNVGAIIGGMSLMAAGWYNTVVRKKSIIGTVCLIGAGICLRKSGIE